MSAETQHLSGAHLAVTAAALEGDPGRVYRLLADLLDEGVSFETVLFDLLVPAQHDVGRRWQDGDYLVAEEHAITATFETVVSLLVGSFDQPESGRHVIIAAAEGDTHSLPGRLVAAHLLFLGFRTTYLGANTLAPDLKLFLESERPEALVLSCAMTTHLLGARRTIAAAHEAGVPVVVGGGAFDSAGGRARKLGADGWAETPRDVAVTLETWEPDPARTESEARLPSVDLESLGRARSSILARAEGYLADRLGDGVDSRMRSEADLLLGALEAALLVDDPSIVDEMVEWQDAALTAQGYPAGSEPLVGSLAKAVGSISTEAAALLR